MRNVQQRDVAVTSAEAGRVIDEIATPSRTVWPHRTWPPLVLDDGLRVGSSGGHGPIRYDVAAHQPGASVVFRFDPAGGLDGTHRLAVEALPDGGSRIVHTIVARPVGIGRVLWPVATRWLHEALLQDLLDGAERELTGGVRSPARWSPWVRVLRRAFGRAARRAERPAGLSA